MIGDQTVGAKVGGVGTGTVVIVSRAATQSVLRPEQISALIAIGSDREGAPLGQEVPAAVRESLQRLGLIGAGGGLTAAGSNARRGAITRMLDEVFS